MKFDNRDQTKNKIWSDLQKLSSDAHKINILDLFKSQKNRAQTMSAKSEGIFFDFSKHLITPEILNTLLAFADSIDLKDKINDMFDGKPINKSENRAVLHTALRADQNKEHTPEVANKFQDINHQSQKIKIFSEEIRSGKWRGLTNRAITDIVNIGIGGSDLGPRMACKALKEFANGGVRAHFVSNVDGTDIRDTISELDPETTLIIISSKTFTTTETLMNAKIAINWLETSLNKTGVESTNHIIGITANTENAIRFGIKASNILNFSNWVGGRYSIWSSIGLSIAIYIGFDNFDQMLKGARLIDHHFRETSFSKNIPIVMALIGFWYNNFLNAQSHAVIPYCERLSLLPSYIQQLDMESNGKSVSQSGEKISYQTGPVIWGQTGTNGQHAFFQLLHQGTKLIPIDFIAPVKQSNSYKDNQEVLLNNMLAQSMALMVGRKEQKTQSYKNYSGNKPSSTILIDELSPKNLGALIAIYEHKTLAQGIIWGINSFDQWGVELGKELSVALGEDLDLEVDESTAQLKSIIAEIRSL